MALRRSAACALQSLSRQEQLGRSLAAAGWSAARPAPGAWRLFSDLPAQADQQKQEGVTEYTAPFGQAVGRVKVGAALRGLLLPAGWPVGYLAGSRAPHPTLPAEAEPL